MPSTSSAQRSRQTTNKPRGLQDPKIPEPDSCMSLPMPMAATQLQAGMSMLLTPAWDCTIEAALGRCEMWVAILESGPMSGHQTGQCAGQVTPGTEAVAPLTPTEHEHSPLWWVPEKGEQAGLCQSISLLNLEAPIYIGHCPKPAFRATLLRSCQGSRVPQLSGGSSTKFTSLAGSLQQSRLSHSL